MIISCPSCDTAYNLPEDAISSDGRKIRCKRCSHVFWARRIPRPLSNKPKIEIFYPNQQRTPERKATNRRATVDAASQKRKSIADFDKRHVRSTLGDLFGASLAGAHQSTISDDAPTPMPSKMDGGGTVMGIPIQSRQRPPVDKSFARDKENPSKGTSFGMPAISRNEFDGDTPIPATTHGMPSVKNQLHTSPTPLPEPRKRQATLWMLGDDEVSSADIARALDNAGRHNGIAASPNDALDALDSHVEGGTAPLSSLATYDDSPQDRASQGGFGRESTLHLEIALDSESDLSDLDIDIEIDSAKEEEAPQGRRSVTLFGLASPISENADPQEEIDADLAKFLEERKAKEEEIASNAELKPREKDTARRLAKFLKTSKSSSAEHDKVDPNDDPAKKTASAFGKLADANVVPPKGTAGEHPVAAPKKGPSPLGSSPLGSQKVATAGPSKLPPKPHLPEPAAHENASSMADAKSAVAAKLSKSANLRDSLRASLSAKSAAPSVKIGGTAGVFSAPPSTPETKSDQHPKERPKPQLGPTPAEHRPLERPDDVPPAARHSGPPTHKPTPSVAPDSPTDLLNIDQPPTRQLHLNSDPATEETRELDRSIGAEQFPEAFPTGPTGPAEGESGSSRDRLSHQTFPPPIEGQPGSLGAAPSSRNTMPPQSLHRNPGPGQQFAKAAPTTRATATNNFEAASDPWKHHPTQRPLLFDQSENTDIIPREHAEIHATPPPSAGNLVIWLVSFLIVLVAGLLVAWFIVMKLM